MGQCVVAKQKADKSKRRTQKNVIKVGKTTAVGKDVKSNKISQQNKSKQKHQRFSVKKYQKQFTKSSKEILLTNDTQKHIQEKLQCFPIQPEANAQNDPNISNSKVFSLNNINFQQQFFDSKDKKIDQGSDKNAETLEVKQEFKKQEHSMYEMNEVRGFPNFCDAQQSQIPLDSCIERSVAQQLHEQQCCKKKKCIDKNMLRIDLPEDNFYPRELCFSPQKRMSKSQVCPVKPLRKKKRTFQSEFCQLRPLDRVKPFLNMEDAQISKFLQETS